MKYKRSVYRTFALITQLGLSMITPIFLCVFLAVFLEKKFSISLFIPLVMGVLAGGRNTYYLAKHANEDPEEKEEHQDE